MKTMGENLIKNLSLALIIVVFVAFHPAGAADDYSVDPYAYSPDSIIIEEFTLDVFPKNPGPNEKVEVTANSHHFDINRADITWSVNGIRKLRGTGEKNLALRTGDVGSKTVIYVIVKTEDGLVLEKTLSIRPAEVDILWEADTYTPPYYNGKALPSPKSSIKITAVPNFIFNGSKISSSNLVYEWQIDYKKVPGVSGYGSDSFVHRSSQAFGEYTVKVVVSSYKKTIVAEKTISISTVRPRLIFYEEGLLEGIKYNKALENSVDLLNNEIYVRAEPYFFSRSSLANLSYEWMMNNGDIDPEDNKNVINLRVDEDVFGTSVIDLRVENPSNLLQFAEQGLRINFGI